MSEEKIKQWYAKKLNKTVEEFDDYDTHICYFIVKFQNDRTICQHPFNYVISRGIKHNCLTCGKDIQSNKEKGKE